MSGSKDISMTVDESNKLRAELGLKPLVVGDDDDGELKPGTSTIENDVLVAPVVPSDKKNQEKLREKLATKKEKRKLEKKLKAVKGLADDADDDESAAAWLKKSKAKRKASALAAKKEAELQAMDEQLDAPEYTSKDLAGLTVKHTKEDIQEGEQMILTLADSGVLDGEDDVLENVNLNDSDRTKESLEAKKGITEYRGYDDDEFDQFGKVKPKEGVLSKYDNIDVITGDEKKKAADGFTLDGSGGADTKQEREAAKVREKLKRQVQTLDFDVAREGKDQYTTEEMAQFKKKKRRKVRKPKSKMLTADDLDDIGQEAAPAAKVKRDATTGGVTVDSAAAVLAAARSKPSLAKGEIGGAESASAQAIISLNDADMEMTIADDDAMLLDMDNSVSDDEAEAAAAAEIEATMRRARKISRKKKTTLTTGQLVAQRSAPDPNAMVMDGSAGGGEAEGFEAGAGPAEGESLTQMQEFVKTVGRKEAEAKAQRVVERRAEAAEEEAEAVAKVKKEAAKATAIEMESEVDTNWKNVDEAEGRANAEDDVDDEDDWKAEINTNRGIMATLQFSKMRGFLDEKKVVKVKAPPKPTVGREDPRFRAPNRDIGRGGNDPLTKPGYKPTVKLEYRDDSGRLLTEQKEIFRYLSHKFHGKQSGKSKMEKRMMKLLEQEASKKMTSGDTPLNTTAIMRGRMESSGQAHVVIQGASLNQPQLKKKKKL